MYVLDVIYTYSYVLDVIYAFSCTYGRRARSFKLRAGAAGEAVVGRVPFSTI